MQFCTFLMLQRKYDLWNILTEKLHRSPKPGLYYRYIRSILHEERKKLKQLYEDVLEDQNAEFINREVIVHSPVRIEHNVTGKFLLELPDMHVRLNRLGFAGYENDDGFPDPQ